MKSTTDTKEKKIWELADWPENSTQNITQKDKEKARGEEWGDVENRSNNPNSLPGKSFTKKEQRGSREEVKETKAYNFLQLQDEESKNTHTLLPTVGNISER